jgi:hypothetical protein
MIDQKLDYLHNNSVEYGFVTKQEGFPKSSIENYVYGNGNINVEII